MKQKNRLKGEIGKENHWRLIRLTKVKNPPSQCGPTPCSEATSSRVGYLTIYVPKKTNSTDQLVPFKYVRVRVYILWQGEEGGGDGILNACKIRFWGVWGINTPLSGVGYDRREHRKIARGHLMTTQTPQLRAQ